MITRKNAIISLLFFLIAVTSSMFYFYLDKSRAVDNVFIEYNNNVKAHDDEVAYVKSENARIKSDYEREFYNFAGDTSRLTEDEVFVKYVEYINETEVEYLETPSESELKKYEKVKNDKLKYLKESFKPIIMYHVYGLIMIILVHLLLLLTAKKNTKPSVIK